MLKFHFEGVENHLKAISRCLLIRFMKLEWPVYTENTDLVSQG